MAQLPRQACSTTQPRPVAGVVLAGFLRTAPGERPYPRRGLLDELSQTVEKAERIFWDMDDLLYCSPSRPRGWKRAQSRERKPASFSAHNLTPHLRPLHSKRRSDYHRLLLQAANNEHHEHQHQPGSSHETKQLDIRTGNRPFSAGRRSQTTAAGEANRLEQASTDADFSDLEVRIIDHEDQDGRAFQPRRSADARPGYEGTQEHWDEHQRLLGEIQGKIDELEAFENGVSDLRQFHPSMDVPPYRRQGHAVRAGRHLAGRRPTGTVIATRTSMHSRKALEQPRSDALARRRCDRSRVHRRALPAG